MRLLDQAHLPHPVHLHLPRLHLPHPAHLVHLVRPVPLVLRAHPAADEAALREEAMADPSVQALFEIFPVEKSKVEEM